MGIWGSGDNSKAEADLARQRQAISHAVKDQEDARRLARLAELTATAKRGLSAFAETGHALAAIQAEELWRLTAPTWSEWCSNELGLTERRVLQLIEAARTCATLRESGKLPASERVARELSGLPESEKLDVWQEAVAEAGGGDPTAELVAKAVRKRKPKKSKRTPVSKPTNYRVPGAAVRVTPRKSGFAGYVAALEHALELARKAEAEAAGLRVA